MSDKLNYEDLNKRLNLVNKSIDKYQLLLSENQKRLDEIIKKAKEDFGVSSIDELRELVVKLKNQEKEELQITNEKVEQAEEIIKNIESSLEEVNI